MEHGGQHAVFIDDPAISGLPALIEHTAFVHDMTFLTEISLWLKDNDLLINAVTAAAAPGGLWVYFDKFRNRIRIKVRKLGLPFGDQTGRGVSFAAENVSPTLTSFEPKFTLTGYSPERKRQAYTYTLDSNYDCQLPPHVSKQFVGWHNNTESRDMQFLWFMTFHLPLSRGRCVHVRFRNSEFKPIGFYRFQWERLMFLWFNKVPE